MKKKMIFVKSDSSSDEKEISILKKGVTIADIVSKPLPKVLQPVGLTKKGNSIFFHISVNMCGQNTKTLHFLAHDIQDLDNHCDLSVQLTDDHGENSSFITTCCFLCIRKDFIQFNIVDESNHNGEEKESFF